MQEQCSLNEQICSFYERIIIAGGVYCFVGCIVVVKFLTIESYFKAGFDADDDDSFTYAVIALVGAFSTRRGR